MHNWVLNAYMTVHRKQWYRGLTSGFLHGSWMHLGINMFVLYMFGSQMERYFKYAHGDTGGMYYLGLYILGIVVANLSSIIKHRDNPSYNALGASGATSALVFSYIVLDPWAKSIGIFIIPPGIIPNIGFGALYLAYCVYMARNAQDNIGHETHFYGALWGAFFMFATQPGLLRVFINKLVFNLFS